MQITTSSGISVTPAPANASAGTGLLSVKSETPPSSDFAAVEDVSLSSRSNRTDLINRESESRLYQRNPDQSLRSSGNSRENTSSAEQDNHSSGSNPEQALQARELEQIRELRMRDREVRAHEQAHSATGGVHAGTANFSYQTGPDGVRYAVGGEVSVDVSVVKDDPQATLDKMQQVQQAALAPAEPSAQDRQIAAEAGQKAAEALNEISQQQYERRRSELDRVQELRAEAADMLSEAKAEQEKAKEKESEEKAVSAAERNAEYNAKMQRINEVLLKISMPPPVSAGQILDDVI